MNTPDAVTKGELTDALRIALRLVTVIEDAWRRKAAFPYSYETFKAAYERADGVYQRATGKGTVR